MGLDEFVCRFGFAHLMATFPTAWKPLSFSSGWMHFVQFLVKQLQHQLPAGTRDTFELQVWSSCTVQNDVRKPIEGFEVTMVNDGELTCFQNQPRSFGFIPDMLDRYTVYTCKTNNNSDIGKLLVYIENIRVS